MVFSTPFFAYLTGDFPFSPELQAFWMAFQGAMAVRGGPNKDRSMHWFHAFLLSVVCGYGGACFTPLWMGAPTSMLYNDLNFAACITAFIVANYLPFDIGYKLGKTFPVMLVTVTFAQLFRSLGAGKFTNAAYEAFKDSPSAYYGIPVFGPIAYGAILGNMSGFFVKGFNPYLENGMPWPFQNGLFCCTFYHFFVHDQDGPIGTYLRKAIHSMPFIEGGMDDKTFAIVAVGLFMQIVGILQMPQLLGPGFSPFNLLIALPGRVMTMLPKAEVNLASEGTPTAYSDAKKKNRSIPSAETTTQNGATATKKKRRRNKKKEL